MIRTQYMRTMFRVSCSFEACGWVAVVVVYGERDSIGQRGVAGKQPQAYDPHATHAHVPPPPQIPFDSTVRVSLDTNIGMIKENPEEGPSCTIAGR